MGNKVLDDLLGTVDDIHVSPVHPRVVVLEGRGQEVVPCLAHGLAARRLGREAMAVLDVLAQREPEILLDDHGAPKGNAVWALLDAVELGGEDGEGVVGSVAHEEPEVDEVVGVRELGEKLKILGEVTRGVLERGEDEDSFFVLHGLGGGLDRVQVDMLDRGGFDFKRGVVVEHDGGTEVRRP